MIVSKAFLGLVDLRAYAERDKTSLLPLGVDLAISNIQIKEKQLAMERSPWQLTDGGVFVTTVCQQQQ